jgi:alcohol oxidase
MIIALYLAYAAVGFDHHIVFHANEIRYYGDHSTLPDGAEYVSMANWTAYPLSRGHIHM